MRGHVEDAAAHYCRRLADFALDCAAPGAIALVGSSHLEWFETDRYLPEFRFANRAIASDRLGIGDRGILHRLEVSAFQLEPRQVVFNNAVNDLGELWRTGAPPFEQIVEYHDKVLAELRAGLPDTPILVVNELPTSGRFAELNPLIREINPHVARHAEKHGCALLDFHAVVVDERGALRADLTWDGLHLDEPGYALFAEHLRPLLVQ